jgi:hypothetical protein
MRRARKLYLAMGIALVAMLVAATAAFATVTFDPATGKGFVGKGDVQLAFGWNNAQLQANGKLVSFTFNDTATYSAVCTFTTGEGTPGEQTHNISIPRHTSVISDVQYDARTHKQIDGYILKGFGATTPEGTVPVVGDACVGNDGGVAQNGTWSSVTLVSTSGGALFVNYGGSSVQLNWPPVV